MARLTAPDRLVQMSFTTGAAFALKPNETRDLPDYVYERALELGCVPAVEPVVEEPAVRLSVKDAIHTLMEGGDTSKLTAHGLPRVGAVSELTGAPVTRKDIEAAMEEIADGEAGQ